MSFDAILGLAVLGMIAIGIYAVWKIKYDEYHDLTSQKIRTITAKFNKEDETERNAALAWGNFQLPSKERFTSQVLSLYQRARPNKPLLREPYLSQLTNVFAEMYHTEFRAKSSPDPVYALVWRTEDPAAAYELLVRLCAEALFLHTDAIAPQLVETNDPTDGLFNLNLSLRDAVLEDGEWRKGQQEAYYQLTKPFRDNRDKLGPQRIFNHFSTMPDIGMDDPICETFEEEEYSTKKYDAAQKKYAAAKERATNKIKPLELPFAHTPLFAYANKFIPEGSAIMNLPIAPEAWFSGTWIVAPPNQGKTNLLHQIIKDRRAHGTIILMDAGTKTELIAPYQHEAFIIEPSQTNPPPINPLDLGSSIHSIELLEYLFSSLLEAKMTPKQSTLFSNVLTLATSIPNATIETVRQILLDGWKKDFEKYVMRLPRRTQEFFTKEQFDGKGDAGYSGTKKELLWRIDLLLRNPYMDAMLQTPNTGIDFTKLLDSGKIITIDCNPELIGYEGAEFFGRLIIALVWNAVRARARAQGTKRPVYFIIDEAQEVIKRDENIPKLLQQCRSQNVAMIFAHQQLNQIDNEKVQYALGDCAIKLAAPRREAPLIAPFFGVDASFFTMPEHHFALQVFSKPPSVVTVELLTMVVRPRPTPPQPASELRWTHRISPILARRGGDYRMKTLKGEIIVTIPPNTKNGATFRLRGCGTLYNDGTRRDIILTLDVPPMPEQQQSDSPLLFFDDDMG